MQALDFPVVNRLHLLPEIANLLFLVISRKKFAESQKRDHIGRQFVTPQDGLKRRSGTGHQPKPQVSGECRSRVAQFVLPIELPNRIQDRKSTRLNSSHTVISYAVFCLKKKKLPGI